MCASERKGDEMGLEAYCAGREIGQILGEGIAGKKQQEID